MALDKDKAGSLFGFNKPRLPVESKQAEVKKPAEHATVEPKKSKEIASQPKWQTLDKISVFLKPEQKEGLDRVAKKIMKYRSKELKGLGDKERVTANTLIRCLIDSFLDAENQAQMEVLSSENEVKVWVKRILARESEE